MKKINLKDYYDHIVIDTYIDVPDEIFNIFEKHRKAEQAHRSKVYYHKAYYSLDHGDGIEHNAVFVSLTPDEIYERKLTNEQLHAANQTMYFSGPFLCTFYLTNTKMLKHLKLILETVLIIWYCHRTD